MEVVIVTGASRGLGAAIAEAMISPERRLVCVARGPNVALEEKARASGSWLDYYLQDLSDPVATDVLARSICEALPDGASQYLLINNAGVVTPVARTDALPAEEVVAALHVNLTAAMLFTSRFLSATEGFSGVRRIVNISSGAARSAYAGWSTYCATKAALDMFSRCVKIEQEGSRNPARIVSLAPGVIDTDMQGEVRKLDVKVFPQVERFRQLKATQQLARVDDVARRIASYVFAADFGENEIDDLRRTAAAVPDTNTNTNTNTNTTPVSPTRQNA